MASRLLQNVLKRLGYQVESTTDPVEAVERFRERCDEFDLIITDMAMPGLTGVEISRQMLQERENIPIILCSGYSESIDPEKAGALGIRKYIEKPIRIRDLAASVRDVLDETEAAPSK